MVAKLVRLSSNASACLATTAYAVHHHDRRQLLCTIVSSVPMPSIPGCSSPVNQLFLHVFDPAIRFCPLRWGAPATPTPPPPGSQPPCHQRGSCLPGKKSPSPHPRPPSARIDPTMPPRTLLPAGAWGIHVAARGTSWRGRTARAAARQEFRRGDHASFRRVGSRRAHAGPGSRTRVRPLSCKTFHDSAHAAGESLAAV